MSDFWVIIAKEQSVWNSDPDELTLLKLAPPWGSPSDTYLPKMKNKINVSNWKMFNLAFFDNLFFIWCFYAWKNSKENMLNCQITGTFPTQLVKIYFRGFSGPGGLSYYQTTPLWQVNLYAGKVSNAAADTFCTECSAMGQVRHSRYSSPSGSGAICHLGSTTPWRRGNDRC